MKCGILNVNYYRLLLCCIVPVCCIGLPIATSAQHCNTISLPDTLYGCDAQGKIRLNATIAQPYTRFRWVPTQGLSDTTILNPLVTVGLNPVTYTLIVYTLDTSIIVNGDFEKGDVGFTTPGYYRNCNMYSSPGQSCLLTDLSSKLPNTGVTDHTSGAGIMLYIDAIATVPAPSWRQTVAVTPNTDYQLEAWINNAYPNGNMDDSNVIQMSVNSSTLPGSRVVALEVPDVWQSTHGTWNSGAATSATVEIINLNGTYGGNDYVLDDISMRGLCTDSASVYIGPCKPHVLNADGSVLDTVYCFENVNHEIIGVPGGGYFWGCGIVDSGGKIYFNPALAAYSAGSYPYKCFIRYTLPTGQDSTCIMTVNRPVIPDAGIDQTICHNSFVLSATGNYNHLQYAWTPATDLNAPGEPTTAGTTKATIQAYTITATDIQTGCKGIDSVTIYNNTLTASFIMSRDSICADDTVLITNTTNGPNPSFLWSLGDGDTSTLNSFQRTYAKGGRYIIQLLVSNTLCTDTTKDTLYVFDHPVDRVALNLSDSIICMGSSVVIDAYVPAGYRGVAWDFGDGYQQTNSTSFRKSYDTEGSFTIRAKAYYTACPDLDTSITLTVIPASIVNIGRDTSICPGDPGLSLTNLHIQSGAYSNTWSTGETTESITVSLPGTYYLSVLSGSCATTDTVVIKPSCYVAIPNVFSPNGDGINDYFFPRQILARGVSAFHMQVYNRWGTIVFETISTAGSGWDGAYNNQIQPEGVYVYIIDVEYINGVAEKYKGNITLLR